MANSHGSIVIFSTDKESNEWLIFICLQLFYVYIFIVVVSPVWLGCRMLSLDWRTSARQKGNWMKQLCLSFSFHCYPLCANICGRLSYFIKFELWNFFSNGYSVGTRCMRWTIGVLCHWHNHFFFLSALKGIVFHFFSHAIFTFLISNFTKIYFQSFRFSHSYNFRLQ